MPRSELSTYRRQPVTRRSVPMPSAAQIDLMRTITDLGRVYGNNVNRIRSAMRKTTQPKRLTQTKLTQRGFTTTKKPKNNKKPTKPINDRHNQLKTNDSAQKVPLGKGYSTTARGTMVTHPRSKVPKWKLQRLKDYNVGNVWQTVLISKPARLPGSNNLLQTYRYPIKAPETLDSERIQCMIFTPFCSHQSGIHTTYFRKIRADGTDLDHELANRCDVIQKFADVQRHAESSGLDRGTQIIYRNNDVSSATTQSAANLANVLTHSDQLVKNVNIDLKFMASRAFAMKISVSLVRMIQPTTPYVMSSDDKKNLTNSLSYSGIDYTDYRVEYCHEFTLPGLSKGKSPPTHNVIKKIKTNFMQTNAFNQNSVADDMSESSATQLGLGIQNRQAEVPDGHMSGNFYILIKYKKVNQPQQFTYHSAIQAEEVTIPGSKVVASIEMPCLTEESFDIPSHAGGHLTADGSPLQSDQGNESRGSFYLHGKLTYNFGFKEPAEQIPSVVSEVSTHADYKKTQSLNIDPTITGNNSYGIYTGSPDHVKIA